MVYKKWWFILLVIASISAIVSSFFLLRIRGLKKRAELLNRQQQLKTALISSQLTALRSQMNPHFMFNALNSIQEYILTNQKELAGDYLGKFSDLMRLYLNHSRVQTISLQEDLDALYLYLDLEKLRFEETLHYTVHIAPSVIPDAISIPSMLIQPYVENAIKHGLLHKKDHRKLEIDFSLNSNKILVCRIRDNGVGREKAALINVQRKNKPHSFATSAIQKRLALLNENRKHKIQATILDLTDDQQQACGTEVELLIP